MRDQLDKWVEKHRIAGEPDSGCYGAFRIPGPLGNTLGCIVSDGRDWTGAGLSPPAWEHVSVSLKHRCATWTELDFVKRLFWRDDEWAMQLHAPPDLHINIHEHVLHLWRPVGVDIPIPPRGTV